MVRDASDVLAILLDGGHSVIAGRLAGAFRNIGRMRLAEEIVSAMRSAEYDVRESDPFTRPAPFAVRARELSPYVTRMQLMWHSMREKVIPHFPPAPEGICETSAYLKHVDEVYVTDAYHSLAIEGYCVTRALIERVRSGGWDPDNNEEDREQRNALAARGYFDAFQSVKQSVEHVLGRQNPGIVAADDHGAWYRQLFAPSVAAGIVNTADLAGYRSGPVYIRKSLHVPPSRDAVRDMMPAFFELLAEETVTGVRVVMGHFVFVYIHPYFDGNGRTARFLMNVMLASGGYPWTVIPVQRRHDYLRFLETASVDQDIVPFARFISALVDDAVSGKPEPEIPEG